MDVLLVASGKSSRLVNYTKDYLPKYMLIGDDYKDKEIIGSELVKEIIYVPRYQGLSSSSIINGTYKTPYL